MSLCAVKAGMIGAECAAAAVLFFYSMPLVGIGYDAHVHFKRCFGTALRCPSAFFQCA